MQLMGKRGRNWSRRPRPVLWLPKDCRIVFRNEKGFLELLEAGWIAIALANYLQVQRVAPRAQKGGRAVDGWLVAAQRVSAGTTPKRKMKETKTRCSGALLVRFWSRVGLPEESEEGLRLVPSPGRGRRRKDVKNTKWRRGVTSGHQAMSEMVRMVLFSFFRRRLKQVGHRADQL